MARRKPSDMYVRHMNFSDVTFNSTTPLNENLQILQHTSCRFGTFNLCH